MKYIRLWTDEIFSKYIILQKVYIKTKKPKTKIKIKKEQKLEYEIHEPKENLI